MEEILPGVHHWRAPHPDIGLEVDSYYLADAQTVLDPLLPDGATPADLPGEVRHVVLTIGLHTRTAPAFGLPLRVAGEGLHRLEGRGRDVEPFGDGDEPAPGVVAHRLGAIAPDDYVLHIATGPGLLAFGDGLVSYDGIRYVPDHLMGDDPEGVKRATLDALEPLLALEFDGLLFAHGTPIPSAGKAALRSFVDAQRG